MLGEPQHLNSRELGNIANREWARVFANDEVTRERVATHFNALIADPDRVQPSQHDPKLVDLARTSLKQASLPVLMYNRLKVVFADDAEHTINLANEVGLGGDAVFIRKSGRALSDAIPALYTRPVFKTIRSTGRTELVAHFVSENWVIGGEIADLAKSPQLEAQLMQLYEDDYIREWDALLTDLALRPTTNTQDAAQLWGLLSAPTSPLKRLLTVVHTNTKLIEPPPKPDLGDKMKSAVGGTLGPLNKIVAGEKKPATMSEPGAKVTKHFEILHRLVEGAPPPIDLTLQKFAAIQAVFAEMSALGGPPPVEASSRLSLALKDLETHAKTLPGPMGALVGGAKGGGESVAKETIGSDFSARYQQQVVAECQELAAGRYPIVSATRTDLPLEDFARLFAPNGTYDTFLRTTMQSFVDMNQPTWQWKPEAASIGGGASMPAQFQRANQITQTYFPAGGSLPKVSFTVTPDYLDPSSLRMVLEIDGQSLEYGHGAKRAMAMTWPGPTPSQAAITIEDRGGAQRNLVEEGPWALFRLLGKADFRAQSQTRFLAVYTLGGKTVGLIIQANSSRNPFARNPLRGFNCQG